MPSRLRCLSELASPIPPVVPLLLVAVWIGAFAASPAGAQPCVVRGQVVDAQGQGLPYANVQIAGTLSGAAADSTGHFRFTTRERGPHVLQATMVGYATATRTVDLVRGDTIEVRLALGAARIELSEAVITGASFDMGREPQAALSPLEAVTTPGASGDLLRALQAFPGVSAPGDGAGLFVRGGDADETQVLIDGAPVFYPYAYASPNGGSFGAVRPFLVKGTALSTGGFSAQYGNALSGVLAIESKDPPTEAHRYLNAGLAGVSLRFDQPIGDAVGLRVSGSRSHTGLLFRANGTYDEFTTVPQGLDGTLSLTWDYGEAGQMKTLHFGRHNRIGAYTQDGAFDGVYRSTSTNQLHVLQWTARSGAWSVESVASWSRYASTESLGALDLQPTDDAAHLRTDVRRTWGDWTLRTGLVAQHRRHHFLGQVPIQPGVLNETRASRRISEVVRVWRAGGYAELAARLLPRVHATAGIRVDDELRPAAAVGPPVVDPRTSVTFLLSPHTELRAAWGFYHQFPEPETRGQHAGPNALGAQQAQHLVAGFRHERGPLLLRAEAYLKPYRDLVVRTGPSRYANAGAGRARGVDLFAKYGAFLETPISGWVAYSLLDAERTQPRDRGESVTLERGPASTEVTHHLSLVGKAQVVGNLYTGVSYRVATGRPFTPVIDAVEQPSGAVLPVDGPVGSARLPAYHRLDLQLSYYWPFGEDRHAVFYAAVNNVFDRANVVGVHYTPDYSKRSWRRTDFVRSFYVGVSLQF
jgi:outer membrane cobalamin receptor